MTEQEQRVAIAKACGWLEVMPSGRLDGQHVGYNPKHAVIGNREEIPDYPNDLNACYEMEATMTGIEWKAYVGILTSRMDFEDGEITTGNCALAIHSKPGLRCRTFLKVKGLWKD